MVDCRPSGYRSPMLLRPVPAALVLSGCCPTFAQMEVVDRADAPAPPTLSSIHGAGGRLWTWQSGAI
jgi:hypothetical protein